MTHGFLARRAGALATTLILLAPGGLETQQGTDGRAEEPGQASGIRLPHDTVGFTHSAAGIARVIAVMEAAERPELEATRRRLGIEPGTGFVGAISPHDDYQYAGQLYLHLYPYLRARHAVMIGVAHHARKHPEAEGKLVFDGFQQWHGPYSPVPISPLRAVVIEALPEADRLVSQEMHAGEHSLEAMVPFLQHYQREVSIVPILVPFMTWDRLEALAGRLAQGLAAAMKERSLALGRDVAVLISSDAVHYGDEDWGGRSFADFGTNGAAYDRAVSRDLALIRDHLTERVAIEKARNFYRAVVAEDCHEYRISWCGRFSIPFGLCLLNGLARELGPAHLRGDLLRYGTTLDPGRRDPGVEGLGVTARASLRHWVGFCSIGYRLEPGSR
ncbi:MAG: AmmeMemoRadiSam system protein B [Planctomycetes bacterium]|nr:AmmeMemoRadiSam system protein B [Planctomycetota bacterium]